MECVDGRYVNTGFPPASRQRLRQLAATGSTSSGSATSSTRSCSSTSPSNAAASRSPTFDDDPLIAEIYGAGRERAGVPRRAPHAGGVLRRRAGRGARGAARCGRPRKRSRTSTSSHAASRWRSSTRTSAARSGTRARRSSPRDRPGASLGAHRTSVSTKRNSSATADAPRASRLAVPRQRASETLVRSEARAGTPTA